MDVQDSSGRSVSLNAVGYVSKFHRVMFDACESGWMIELCKMCVSETNMEALYSKMQ